MEETNKQIETELLPKTGDEITPTYYVNNIQLTFGAYDFILSCGMMIGPQNTKGPSFNIVMSPEHTKTVALLLKDAIKSFEERTNTTIPVPAEFREMADEF